MKNIVLVILTLLISALLVITSCKKKEDIGTPPVPVHNFKGSAGYGEVIFTWDAISKNPLDSANFLYTSIGFADIDGKFHEQKFSRYATSAVIGGLDHRPYTFTVKTFGPGGAATDVATLSITPDLPAYQIVSKTLQIEGSIGSARVSWINNTGKIIVINAAYTDASGVVVYKSFTSSAINGVGYIGNLPSNQSTTLLVTASDASGKKSKPVSATVTPSTEVKLSNSLWTISGFSDQEAGGEGPVNGYAKAAIDGNINTFWHSTWSTGNPPYPHWIAINTGKIVTISKIGLFNRQKASSGQTEIQLMGSLNGNDWSDLGTFPFQQNNAEQTFSIAPQKWQYIKIILTKGPNFYGYLAEVNLYGSQ